MEVPQGTHTAGSDDSEEAAAESDPGGESTQDELKKLLKDYMSADEKIDTSKIQNFLSKVTRSEQIDALKEKDEAGDTALHHAAANGDTETLQSLLGELSKQECFEVLSQQNKRGETTLHRATTNAKKTAINQILISSDRPFELAKLQDNDENTALHYAVRNSDDALCKLILGPLAQKEHYDIMLISNKKGFNVVHEVTIQNNIGILKSILAALTQDHKAEVLAQHDKDGNTVMHLAVNLKDTDILTYIFDVVSQEQAFNLASIQNYDGNTAMHLAAADRLDIITKHLEHAKVFLTLSIQNMKGNTVIAAAAETGSMDVLVTTMGSLEGVKEYYELLKIRNKRGYNALHSAARKRQSEVIDCFASNLSEQDFRKLVHAHDSDGNTVLHLASKEGYEDVLAAITKHKGAKEEKIVKQAQEEVSQKKRGEMGESTDEILIGLTAELSRHGEQLARLMDETQAIRTEFRELRLTNVELRAELTPDMPADSLTHPTMEQRDETPTGVEMPDEPVQTSGSTLESASSISASTIPLVMHPTSENQTSSVVRLGGQSNPATEMPTLIAELESISIEIGRILDRVEAGHSIMILDPDDYHKIYILGVNVQNGQVEFRALTSQEDFQSFTIIPHNLVAVHKGLPQYIKQFMPFDMEKEKKIGEKSVYSTNHAKCQLIVRGRQANSRQGDKYYGVTVAHAFLSNEERICLWDKDHAAVLAVEQQIDKDRTIDWRLKGSHCKKREQYINVDRSPLIRYRLYFDDEYKVQEDLAVFEISEPMMRSQLPNYPLPSTGLPNYPLPSTRLLDPKYDMRKLAVFTSGFNGQPYTVKGIIPIRTFEEIKLLVGKRVLIAFAEGKVTLQAPTPPPRSVQRNNMKLGLMLTFVATSQYSLEPGHSGYMVYLVDKDDRHVYIAGMLTGKINCPDLAKVIYTAALVGAGLEMHSVLNLKPLIDGLQGRTVQTLHDDLQGIGSLDPRNPLA